MKGFIHQKGKEIHDGNGKSILLKGVGFGNWLLPEGYMWKFYDDCDRPRRIENLILDLTGEEYSKRFWKQYFDSYITKDDIEYIKSRGLNSVRLPINARYIMNRDNDKRTLSYKGIEYIDKLLKWCEENEIYVILDMHGAPGGQTGTNIDDSENDSPELFIDNKYRDDLIWLWTELAKRYKDRNIIAGYDLINEPLPEWFNEHNDKVMPMYYDITNAIRQVDKNHMIILEGVHWATDWSIFESLKENTIENCMLQFHKYWDNPDTESIQKFLDKRDELNYPIFMGEGGENNMLLYAGVFHLLDQHNISWNFWSYKKMGTHNSPISFNMPEGWDGIIEYIKGGCSPDNPKEIFDEFLNNIKFENSIINEGVLNHAQRIAPIKIRAIFYDLLNERFQHNSNVNFRAGDKADIRFVDQNGELSFKHDAGQDINDNQRLCLAMHMDEGYKYTFNSNCGRIYIKCMSSIESDLTIKINDKKINCLSIDKEMKVYDVGNAEMGVNLLELSCNKGIVEVELIEIDR